MKNLLDEITQTNPKLIDHCERVAMLAMALGKHLEVANHLMNRLYFTALFHDIGKYKTNIEDCSLVSAAIVRSHEEYYKIADFVMQCSENIDGTGPLKMTNEDMHLFPMIVRICDIYDNNRISKEEIAYVEDWINNRPMKILGYKTPNEVCQLYIVAIAS